MSFQEDNIEVIPVSKTDLVPTVSKDSPSIWERFWKPLFTSIGFRSLYYLEEWFKAKIRQKNAKAERDEAEAFFKRAEGEAKLMEAEAKFEASQAMSETIGS